MMVHVSSMLRPSPPITLSLFSLCLCFCCAVILGCSALHAQENCNVEVKLLLSPAETQAAVSAFNGTRETPGRIYFFDTDKLDLLSQGAIVRLRQGAKSDLTIKFRPLNGKTLSATTGGGGGFKCEVDLTGEGANSSYSITRQLAAGELPQTGTEVSRLLSSAQIELFKQAGVSVDWARVNRVAEITATDWQTQSQPHVGKLTLELWEWPAGKVLELSTKVTPDAGPSAYARLLQLVKEKRLAMSPDQRAKTSLALESITHALAH
jgi:hypothetical protein